MEYAVHQLVPRRQGRVRQRRHATNVTYAAMDPFFALVRSQSSMAPPVSNNWGFINNPKFDELGDQGAPDLDPAARDAALAELHAAS